MTPDPTAYLGDQPDIVHWIRAQAGVVIIKAHTPGAKRSRVRVENYPYRLTHTLVKRLTTNRKVALILDRYIAVHLTRAIFLIPYNPIDKLCQVVYKNKY